MRPEVSKKNKYWISKNRQYELKYFCLQYPEWKREYAANGVPSTYKMVQPRVRTKPTNPTEMAAIKKSILSEKIELIEETAKTVDGLLYDYILKGVTEGLSYSKLKAKHDIPCNKDTYYERYRRFFWTLDKMKD